MTPDELKDFLEENKASIQAAVQQKVIDQILQNHSWQITDEIRTVVQDFVSTEIVPAVKSHLQSQKGPILEAAIAGASEVGENIAKALAEHSAKNLVADSYKFRQVLDALFK